VICPNNSNISTYGSHAMRTGKPLSLDEVRKVHIQKVLQMCNGNRLRATQILGIGRTSLYRYLKRDGSDTLSRVHTSGAAA
jgi:ActR/RegA family two-component response regulator